MPWPHHMNWVLTVAHMGFVGLSAVSGSFILHGPSFYGVAHMKDRLTDDFVADRRGWVPLNPQIFHFNIFKYMTFHYKPSILGYPHAWKPPFGCVTQPVISNHTRIRLPCSDGFNPGRVCSWGHIKWGFATWGDDKWHPTCYDHDLDSESGSIMLCIRHHCPLATQHVVSICVVSTYIYYYHY